MNQNLLNAKKYLKARLNRLKGELEERLEDPEYAEFKDKTNDLLEYVKLDISDGIEELGRDSENLSNYVVKQKEKLAILKERYENKLKEVKREYKEKRDAIEEQADELLKDLNNEINYWEGLQRDKKIIAMNIGVSLEVYVRGIKEIVKSIEAVKPSNEENDV